MYVQYVCMHANILSQIWVCHPGGPLVEFIWNDLIWVGHPRTSGWVYIENDLIWVHMEWPNRDRGNTSKSRCGKRKWGMYRSESETSMTDRWEDRGRCNVDTEDGSEDQNCGGAVIYKQIWIGQKIHKTGEHGERKLYAPTPNREKAQQGECLFWYGVHCTCKDIVHRYVYGM